MPTSYIRNSMTHSNVHIFVFLFLFGVSFSEVKSQLGDNLGLPNPAEKSAMIQRSLSKVDDIKKEPLKGATDKVHDVQSNLIGDSNTTTPAPVKLKASDDNFVEPDCVESMFMSPFHNPVNFTADATNISHRRDPTCRWQFYGTEACIPVISCGLLNLKSPNKDGNCVEEYFEVSDGYTGLKKYCGKEGPKNISAAEDLRDLYITVKVKKHAEGHKPVFTCTVECTERGASESLPSVATPKVNPKCSCGNKPNDDRIVNGENATRSEFPWLAAMVEASTRQPFCGGSILNDRYILTAGHCIKGRFMDFKNIEIILNGHIFDSSPNLHAIKGSKPKPLKYTKETIQQLDAGNSSIRFQVEEVIVHPLYVAETNDFDVALIRLKKPIDFAEHKIVNPICLPTLGSYLRTFAARNATIAGWGLPDVEALGTPTILQKLSVNVFSPKECKDFYAHRVNRRMLCAGYTEGGKDSCAGDSGGPLVLEDRKKVWYQIGSVSWGEGCATPLNPGVYFRTTESGQWINYHSNSNEATWCAVPGNRDPVLNMAIIKQ